MQPHMIPAQFLYDRLTEQFKPDRCTDIFDKIGVQEHNTDMISKVYTSTFANPTSIENILSRGEEHVLLFCHHPRPPMPSLQEGYGLVPEALLERMKEQQVSFFSFHIPLDVAGPYSPGTTLGRAMGANVYDSWYPQNGALLGRRRFRGLLRRGLRGLLRGLFLGLGVRFLLRGLFRLRRGLLFRLGLIILLRRVLRAVRLVLLRLSVRLLRIRILLLLSGRVVQRIVIRLAAAGGEGEDQAQCQQNGQ